MRPGTILGLAVLAFAAPIARAAHDAPAPAPPARVVTEPAVRDTAAPRPNVLFVTFDTLRRDHVSCYGHDVVTTPVIDGLARAGVRFTDCLAVVPITGPSHASMMTGLHPQQHGAFRNGVKVKADRVLLPEVMRRHGYIAGAVVSGWTLKDAQCGLARGFDAYDDGGMTLRYNVVNNMRPAPGVTAAALAWIDATKAAHPDAPWFLFAHYFDPHEPYVAPTKLTLAPNPAACGSPRCEVHRELLPDYDQEIAFADQQLGVLLDGLRQRGELENALIVFTADHGQSFGDNGYGGPEGAHGRRVNHCSIAVPLVMAWTGHLGVGSTCTLPVSHVDLAPTLVELLGLPASELPADLPGASLSRVLRDPTAAPPWGRASRVRRGLAFRGAVGNKWNIFRWMQNKNVDQAEPLQAFEVVDNRKVIVDFAHRDRVEVYDLAKDPGEATDLARKGEPIGDSAETVFAWYDRTRDAQLEAPQPSAEDLEKLRALGYVE